MREGVYRREAIGRIIRDHGGQDVVVHLSAIVNVKLTIAGKLSRHEGVKSVVGADGSFAEFPLERIGCVYRGEHSGRLNIYLRLCGVPASDEEREETRMSHVESPVTSRKGLMVKVGGGPGVPMRYGYGYWSGPERDLLCVWDNVRTNEKAEGCISPLSRFRWLAYLKFMVKRIQLENRND